MNCPSLLYKYKSINTVEDLCYIIDIIDNHHIYMPTYDQLNDPLEANMIDYSYSPWAGCSMLPIADQENALITYHKMKYRVLSLTDIYNEPLMWAHYSDNYTGICLCFRSTVFKETIHRVDYRSKRVTADEVNEKSLQNQVYQGFLMKEQKWAYEHEYRIVSSDTENKYFDFQDNLLGIIIGHNMPETTRSVFVNHYKNHNIKFMKTHVGYMTNSIRILPVDYRIDYNEIEPDFIDDISSYI